MKYLFLITLFPFMAEALDPKVVYQSVKNNEAILIDVREKEEIELGMIKEAKWMALSSTETPMLMKLKEEQAPKKIYVYCRSGVRAEKFIQLLKKIGVKADNLGGYEDLKRIGLPVTK